MFDAMLVSVYCVLVLKLADKFFFFFCAYNKILQKYLFCLKNNSSCNNKISQILTLVNTIPARIKPHHISCVNSTSHKIEIMSQNRTRFMKISVAQVFAGYCRLSVYFFCFCMVWFHNEIAFLKCLFDQFHNVVVVEIYVKQYFLVLRSILLFDQSPVGNLRKFSFWSTKVLCSRTLALNQWPFLP